MLMDLQNSERIDYIKFECFFKLPDVSYECILMSQYDTTITVNGHGYTTHNRETDFDNICDLAKRIIQQHHEDDLVDNGEYWVLTIGYTMVEPLLQYRNQYNGYIHLYNQSLFQFPYSIVARWMHLAPMQTIDTKEDIQ